MLFGAAGQAASMAILAATTANAVGPDKTKYGIAAAVFLFVFNSFFAVGWLGMTWYVRNRALIVDQKLIFVTQALSCRDHTSQHPCTIECDFDDSQLDIQFHGCYGHTTRIRCHWV
jgi:hypothetical protein